VHLPDRKQPSDFLTGKGRTLYLDEIDSMPLNLQAKLLRAIQEKKFRRIGGTSEINMECKIISSVNKDPLVCVKEGKLRQDLYYRLGVMTLHIPPLRDRKEDIPKLIQYFLLKYSQIYGNKKITLGEELFNTLKLYDWPGNVRELEHIFERAISLMEENEELTIYNLPPYLRQKLNIYKFLGEEESKTGSLNDILREVEKRVIVNALETNRMI
jgi:arginine utilization regulatory protein